MPSDGETDTATTIAQGAQRETPTEGEREGDLYRGTAKDAERPQGTKEIPTGGNFCETLPRHPEKRTQDMSPRVLFLSHSRAKNSQKDP